MTILVTALKKVQQYPILERTAHMQRVTAIHKEATARHSDALKSFVGNAEEYRQLKADYREELKVLLREYL